MGTITIKIAGSFDEKNGEHFFSASEFGHAQMVTDVIKEMTNLLTWAIRRNHELHEKGQKPTVQFGAGVQMRSHHVRLQIGGK